MKVSSIDCRRLKKIIRKECGTSLIVDCRPYFSFSNSNIKGSVNANLNSVVVRRSRGGPVPLQFVIPEEKALLRLREGSISAVVVLDDRTPHWQKLKKDSIAQIVINTLNNLASGTNIFFAPLSTSFLTPMPLQTPPLRHFKLSPITALP
uniref:Dual specificity phosphatase 5 n=1 Tax=Salmo trutta TaxID=8032 RepID=A0A674E8P0_SALTR